MYTVTKIFEFAYAHYLPGYEGKCKLMHGHTGILEIEVSGPQTISDRDFAEVYDGMIIDFSDLKKIITDSIISKLDHSLINDILAIPTAENIVDWIVGKLHPIFLEHLERVRLYETPSSYAEWRKV